MVSAMALEGPTDEAYESLCRRCGQSCHFGVLVNERAIIIDDIHCRFLVRESEGRFSCSVYGERYSRAPWCHSAQQALEGGFLAQDCPYAKGVRGYRGKSRLHKRLASQIEPLVREELLRSGVPAGVSEEALRRFLMRTGGDAFDLVASDDPERLSLKARDA